ncbi:MAG: hypothetical protein MJE63_25950 [Proteobacteria bacterium]|nr:hypothetical protein [Pseudomonadota bacterium]
MLCLISAIETELRWLIEKLGARQETGNKIWFASQPDVIIAPVGVGFLESAINVNKLLDIYPQINKLLFTGSAGVYPNISSIKPGDICSCLETVLADGAAEHGFSLYAEPLPRTAIPATFQLGNDLYPSKIATLLTLTQSDALAETIQKKLNVELETMELYGIAQVCRKRSLPWNAIIGITNQVGSSGHLQWRKSFREVAAKTGEILLDQLKDI